MSQISDQIEIVEVTIENAKAAIDLGKRAENLFNNPDFNKIVNEGYLKNEAVRLTYLLNDPSMANHQDVVLDDLKAIAAFRRYMDYLVKYGRNMESELFSHQETLEELRVEDMESDDGRF